MNTSLENLYGRPGFLIKRCHQVTGALFLDYGREFGITPSQYGALCALREFPGLDQLAVGRIVGLDRSTAGMVIKHLAARGLVERSVNAMDNRRMRLKLAPAGRRFLAEFEPTARRIQETALRALPPAKRDEFLSLLVRFLQGHGAIINPEDVMAGKPFGSKFDALIASPRRAAAKARAKRPSAARKPLDARG